MTNDELNDWSESLRGKLEIVSAISGAVLCMVILLVSDPVTFGFSKESGGGGILLGGFFAGLGSLAFSLFVYHSILVRQLALPAAIVGAIYVFFNFQDTDLHRYLLLSGLIIFLMIVIGITEARSTTGKPSDFWRSFLFHPLGWADQFEMKTNLK